MGSKGDALKKRIVEQADALFYQRGYDKTSFSDIAAAVNISRGNFYYHFKSKDAILEAVIQNRIDSIRAMLEQWSQSETDPRKSIEHFIDLMTNNQDNIQQYGCPVGSLCLELTRIQHAMRDDATRILQLFREWLGARFRQLGHDKQADNLAMHVLTCTQGLAALMTSFDDDFHRQEIESLKQWLAGLEAVNNQ